MQSLLADVLGGFLDNFFWTNFFAKLKVKNVKQDKLQNQPSIIC